MSTPRAHQYWQAIDALEAQETLAALVIADYPNRKVPDKKKVLQFFQKRAYPNQKGKPLGKIMSNEEFANFLKKRAK